MATADTSIYSMLMTVLFYTTASLCALRAAAWLSTHLLLLALSRIISYYYIDYYYYTNSGDDIRSSSSPPPLAGSPGRQASDAGTGTGTGTLFKLVRTAAGHILFVPVSVAGPGEEPPAESFSLRMTHNAMRCFWLTLVCTVLITSYPYYIKVVRNSVRRTQRGGGSNRSGLTTPPKLNSNAPRTPPPSPTRISASTVLALTKVPSPDDSDDSEGPAFKTRTKTRRLNPAAPVFTPSLAHRRLLIDPTASASARAFAFALAPASPADSPGPTTPLGSSSPVRGTFTFAIAAHAARRRGIKGGTDGSPLPLSLGVGKMHMVLPEDMIVSGERQAEGVFVF